MTTLEKQRCVPLISRFNIIFCIELPQGVQKAYCYTKIYQEKRSNCLRLLRFKPNVEKTAYSEKRMLTFNIKQKNFFLENPYFKHARSPKNACLRRNHPLFFDKKALKLFLIQ